MKKIFSFAIVAAAVGMMVSCGGKTTTAGENDSTATEEPVVEEEVAEPEIHERWNGDYVVTLPAGWEADEYASEMIVKNDTKGLKLKFREFPGGNFDNCVKNSDCLEENRADDIVVGDVTWQVYKADRDEYHSCYLAKFPNDEVIIVWASPDDPANADVHEIIKGVALK